MVLGSVQGVFLSFFVLNNKEHRKEPKQLLTVLMIVASLLFLLGALFVSRYTEILIFVGPFILPAFTLLGPLLFLYIYSMLNSDFTFKKTNLLYIIPYLIAFLYLSKIYFLPAQEQIEFIEKFYANKTGMFEQLFRYFDISYRLIFLILSIKVLTSYRKKLENEFSSTDSINFNWLKNLLIFYLFTIIISVIVTVFGLSNDFRVMLAIYLAILMYVVGYKFMKGSENEIKIAERISTKKYEKSGLSEEKKSEIIEQLTDMMENEKLYLEPEISARFLAEKLDVSINYLSQAINENYNKNFFEFINSYRIDDAKKLLTTENQFSNNILSIAFEVGFQSKSTFNSVFKKQTGKTPTQFRKSSKK